MAYEKQVRDYAISLMDKYIGQPCAEAHMCIYHYADIDWHPFDFAYRTFYREILLYSMCEEFAAFQ